MHCPGGNATDPIWRVLASSDGISSLKPQHSNHNPNPLANQLWCNDFLTPPTPLIIPHRLHAFLESLMPLKGWCSIHGRRSKSSLKHSIRFCGIFSKFKTEFYFPFYHKSRNSTIFSQNDGNSNMRMLCKNFKFLRTCKQTAAICLCNTIYQRSRLLTSDFITEGRKCDLTASVKSVITSELAKDRLILGISKIIGRYHPKGEKIVTAPTKARKRADKGHRRVIFQCFLSRIKREAGNKPGLTSGELLRCTGDITMSRTIQHRLMKKVRTSVRSVTTPPLTKYIRTKTSRTGRRKHEGRPMKGSLHR